MPVGPVVSKKAGQIMRLAGCKTLASARRTIKGVVSLVFKHPKGGDDVPATVLCQKITMTLIWRGLGSRVNFSASATTAPARHRSAPHPTCRYRHARSLHPCGASTLQIWHSSGEATAVLCSGTRLKSKPRLLAARLQQPMPSPSPEMTRPTTGWRQRATRHLAFYG